MFKARALHYVLKIGDRNRMIQFLRDLLGMKVIFLFGKIYFELLLFFRYFDTKSLKRNVLPNATDHMMEDGARR